MKTIKISDDDLKEIVKKVYSEQLRPSKGNLPQSFGFDLEKKPTDHRKIKDCEKIYLESVMSILGKGKYKKWISCYKYHYKNRK